MPVKATLAGMVYAIYSGFWFLSLWLFSFYCLYCISILMTQNTMTTEFPKIKGRSFCVLFLLDYHRVHLAYEIRKHMIGDL